MDVGHPRFREAATPSTFVPTGEEDISPLTPRNVLEHLLHDARSAIRLRAADLLSKLDAPTSGAPGTKGAEVLQVFFAPNGGSVMCPNCFCENCEKSRAAANAKPKEREPYVHATRRELAPEADSFA